MTTPALGGSRIRRKPGLHRLTARPDRWVDDDGAEVTDDSVRARLARLAIPPSWGQVWAEIDPTAPVQATGVDARGRTQYRYAAAATALASRQKFEHMLAFAEVLPRLRARVADDLVRASDTPHDRPAELIIAAVVRLLERGLFRIGNERYARDNHTYGLTTITRNDVGLRGEVLRFDFVGKEHVRQTVSVADGDVARVIARLLSEGGSPADPLFVAGEPERRRRIHSTEVNAYLHAYSGAPATAKTFRTWGATAAAVAVIAGADPPPAALAARSLDGRALRTAAALLGNTPSVARASYIHPAAYRAGRSEIVIDAVARASVASETSSARALFTDPDVQSAIIAAIRDDTGG